MSGEGVAPLAVRGRRGARSARLAADGQAVGPADQARRERMEVSAGGGDEVNRREADVLRLWLMLRL